MLEGEWGILQNIHGVKKTGILVGGDDVWVGCIERV